MNQETHQIMKDKSSTLYFSVSKTKLAAMSIFSWGLYELYWFYKNWELIKERTGRDISPWGRAIFFPFFCYSLFKSVKESAHSHGILSEFNPGLLAFIYIALEIVSDNLPPPYWLFTYLTFLPLLPVQEVINQINLKVAGEYELNDRFSWKNIVVILLGGIMLLLTLTETFMPE